MLKKLRAKFILINMAIVTVTLIVIFGVLFQTTRQALDDECSRTLQSLAREPLLQTRPGQAADGIHLPYFIL